MAKRKFRTKTWGQHLRFVIKFSLGIAAITGGFGALLDWLAQRTRAFYHIGVPAVPLDVPVTCGAVLGLAAGLAALILLRPRDDRERGSDGDGPTQVGGRLWTGTPDHADDGAAGRHRPPEPVT